MSGFFCSSKPLSVNTALHRKGTWKRSKYAVTYLTIKFAFWDSNWINCFSPAKSLSVRYTINHIKCAVRIKL